MAALGHYESRWSTMTQNVSLHDSQDRVVAPLRHISYPEEGVKSAHALAEQLNASGWEGISGAVSIIFNSMDRKLTHDLQIEDMLK